MAGTRSRLPSTNNSGSTRRRLNFSATKNRTNSNRNNSNTNSNSNNVTTWFNANMMGTTKKNVPPSKRRYLRVNVGSNGKVKTVYHRNAFMKMLRERNTRSPLTRRRFHPNNIRRYPPTPIKKKINNALIRKKNSKK